MGEFTSRVQGDKIAGPLRRAFAVSAWKKAFDTCPEPDDRDRNLYEAGMLVHKKLSSIRTRLTLSSSPRLSATTKLRAFVAAANHNYFVAFDKSLAAMTERGHKLSQEKPDNFRLEELLAVKLELPGGVEWTPAEIVESIIDGIEVPVRFSLQSSPDLAGNPRLKEVTWSDISLELNLGAFYCHAEDLWDECLWNKYRVVDIKGWKAFLPGNLDVSRGFSMGLVRRVSLSIGFVFNAAKHYRKMVRMGGIKQNREVAAIGREGKFQRLTLSKPSGLSQLQEDIAIARAFAVEPYYSEILREPHDAIGGASVDMLLSAWGVITQATRLLMDSVGKEFSEGIGRDCPEHIWLPRYAPVLQTAALAEAVMTVSGVTRPQAFKLVEFLTFQGKAGQEIWAQPLIPVGVSTVAPVFGAAIASNLRRLVDVWLRQLSFDLSLRGPAFEAHLRASVDASIAESEILSARAWCLKEDYTFRPTLGREEQIDLIFAIGSTVIVAEAKCILEPTEAKSVAMHYRTVKAGAEQARRKSQAILDYRNDFIAEMKQLGFDLAFDFKVVPLVVVSTACYVGVSVDGVPVVDEYIIERFLNGEMEDVAIYGEEMVVRKLVKTVFYSTVEEAQDRAADYFCAPPQMRRFRDGLKERATPLYPVGDNDWPGVFVTLECIPQDSPLASGAAVSI